jgi:hypothetical protein
METGGINMRASVLSPEAVKELAELAVKAPPPRYKYVLTRLASGELAFVQDEVEIMLRRAIAEAFGKPRPRRRVIKIGLPRGKRTVRLHQFAVDRP